MSPEWRRHYDSNSAAERTHTHILLQLNVLMDWWVDWWFSTWLTRFLSREARSLTRQENLTKAAPSSGLFPPSRSRAWLKLSWFPACSAPQWHHHHHHHRHHQSMIFLMISWSPDNFLNRSRWWWHQIKRNFSDSYSNRFLLCWLSCDRIRAVPVPEL